jgi:hypothetical protein
MKPQPGRMQPLLFNPFTMWTDIALKTGEIMLASAHAAERAAKVNGSPKSSSPKSNGKTKRSAKRRTRK